MEEDIGERCFACRNEEGASDGLSDYEEVSVDVTREVKWATVKERNETYIES